ncbi:Pycsar system effector family protein [Tenacibaculum sp. 1_MG-2023]|uniref:Pycsar system effector family protein n=1 Tax=Tenacibaculum sp. 1_MG-2023 TaxID=3062653 RepID=UPI0026E43018|nr:Pycsar system effector family protein [Tenacibaculum sp. 1_MG-2023]MDO6599398.1 DUF5706 domain-containing protein [Tenacibaculum sp. 1_MG-2023]
MDTLISKTENFVINFLNSNLEKSFVYHNVSHTQRVVEKTGELIEVLDLSEIEKENLIIAAWFHDVGYTKVMDGHEKEGVKIAAKFLKENGLASERIDAISKMILSTEMGVAPVSEFEKILNDADCSHLGSKNFSYLTELLRREWELSKDRVLNESDWLSENIDFLTNKHRYYTSAASKIWDKQKSKNLAQLIKTEKKIKAEATKFKHKKEELAHKKSKIELPERGVETMFRVALRNHITLSDIADTKANILLSVNAIIISMALSTLLPKLDNPSNDYLIIPSIIFIAFTVASIVLSIMATRPNVTQGKFTKEDVANKKVNLLFFGNFHQMKLQEFEWAMDEMMKDRDYLYSSLTKDLYFLGLVLNRKYGILRLTYTVFMIGILVSVLAFAYAFYTQGIA